MSAPSRREPVRYLQGKGLSERRLLRVASMSPSAFRYQPQPDRHPLARPMAANQVWSMDFVFDWTAERRVIKSLTIVDDATHEAVAIVPERAMTGVYLTRVLDQLAQTRGLHKAIRTDNGKEFCSRAMLDWAHAQGIQLFLIEQGKTNQNAYIKSFNGRFRDECLDEHWLTSLRHA